MNPFNDVLRSQFHFCGILDKNAQTHSNCEKSSGNPTGGRDVLQNNRPIVEVGKTRQTEEMPWLRGEEGKITTKCKVEF